MSVIVKTLAITINTGQLKLTRRAGIQVIGKGPNLSVPQLWVTVYELYKPG